MHVHFEQTTSTRTDSTIHSLSWMGKVPDGLPDEGGGWKLNRSQYYMEGWLASGNAKGVVGVTFTTSHCRKYEAPPRSNFNLRGHRSEVILVRWNEPYQKLATCDSRGVIFVWIKHEGRWSIELINDRNSQVTDFAWSHDGRMALICYRDGFVLVGSVAGQRYWSSMLNLDNTSISCGVWSPDDQKVMFGTTDGQIIVMSSTGAMISQVTVHDGMEISSMAWSCERFNMEEAESSEDSTRNTEDGISKTHTLAVCFKYGDIFLLSGYDDVCPRIVYTTLTGLKMDWSNCGEYLAVGGFIRLPNLQCRNELHFYTKDGKLKHWVTVPSQVGFIEGEGKPLTALTWGHNDKRLFIAAGCHLYVAWISKQVAPLQFLCQRVIQKVCRQEKYVDRLPLPTRLRLGAQALFSPTIKSYTPDPFKLREFVSTPPPGNERLFCTMIRHGDETSGGHYTLYLEYLGGLVPLLKGKRASKLRPDFVIFDPKIKTTGKDQRDENGDDTSSNSESDTDISSEGCGSPRMQRKRRQKHFRAEKVDRSITFRTLDELLYNDNLPESCKLVEVTSNIWGTKFQLVGCASYLPEMLGHVVYKTSLLHLQPRQMTITLCELCGSSQQLSRDPNFTPAGMSEDDDSSSTSDGLDNEVTSEPVDKVMPVNTDLQQANQISVDVQPARGEACRGEDVSSALNGHNDSPNATFLPTRLSHSGSIRSRSLSPIRNGLNHNSLAFKLENGSDSNVVKENYANQGARPKVRKCTPLSATASVKASNVQQGPANGGAGIILSSTDATTPNVPRQSPSSTDSDTVVSSDVRPGDSPRWADPASEAIKYIDEETPENTELPFENNLVGDCSPTAPTVVDLQRRLYLAQQGSVDFDPSEETNNVQTFSERNSCDSLVMEEDTSASLVLFDDGQPVGHGSVDRGINVVGKSLFKETELTNGGDIEILHSASLPASPVRKIDSPTRKLREEILKGKCRHLSPVFRRKTKHSRAVDSSDEDILLAIEEMKGGHSYKNLETFQKSQLKQKLRRVRGSSSSRVGSKQQFVMHNKAPLWNENSQVYQLDFGGRVTQESAKNFQIEFRGKQVMQFGRIDSNAYTLDFQYPFTAIQAFAVALANVTQRLK
ncbi:tubby-related protein 4-like isoform X1 [Haliotis asinina]|uniref:tubby-related protein 4-like isoform X1 n=1 Tax=Haliotis asinina TaxID=109174 RepID=UPI003532588A